jgi:hypothetical protein
MGVSIPPLGSVTVNSSMEQMAVVWTCPVFKMILSEAQKARNALLGLNPPKLENKFKWDVWLLFIWGRTTATNDLFKSNRQEILRIAALHGASNIRIFGSESREEAGPESNLDLLVDMEKKEAFWTMLLWCRTWRISWAAR